YGAFGVAVLAAVIQLLFATALIIACYREQLVTPGKTYWLRVAVFLPVVFLLFRFTGLLYFPIQVIISVAGATGYAFALQLVDRDIFRQFFSRSKPAE
ncbi:MAG: hypothetical protein JNM68_02575, partial [Dinghuibacter sp.]|nr:hypothetical protein [Dinghuibacter sp.]